MIYRILHTEWSMGWGGQEQRIVLECRKLIEVGHSVTIACQPGSGILAKARAWNIPVEEVVIRGSMDLRAILRISLLIKEKRIQVVNTHSGKDSWVAGFAAKLAGADLLVRTRHLSVPVSSSPLNFIYKMADGIVTTGTAIRETMIRDNRINPDRIVSIATGVELERFTMDSDALSFRRELGIGEHSKLVTMVAVLRSMKRHDILIEAGRLLKASFPDVTFLVVGEGPMRGSIEKQIQESGLGDNFILTGYREDIPRILAATDLFVLTSSKFEGVPQSISQAMAMGKAVVAAPVGSIPELVLHEKTGLLVENGNSRSFADAILSLLSNNRLREEMGRRGREHVLKEYTADVMIEKTIAFYDHLYTITHKLKS